MITVRFIEPDSVPEFLIDTPACEGTRYFTRSTHKDFLLRLRDLGRRKQRQLFVATEEDRAVAIGLTQVRRVLPSEGDKIRLSGSHAKHSLQPSLEPLKVGYSYQLAIDPASRVILKAVNLGPEEPPAEQVSLYPITPRTDLQPVTREEAERFFSLLRRQPHIPFQYPADGCFARAHEMCRLIERHFDRDPRNVVGKIWNRGDLVVRTENNPMCQVEWGIHVAPVVKVDDDLIVIDPALFESTVCAEEWRHKQSDPEARRFFSTRHAYQLTDDEKAFVGDDDFRKTEADLRFYREELFSLIHCHGPLPYLCER